MIGRVLIECTDANDRQNSGPFIPSLSLAVRLLLLVRVSAAMYSNIQDCDEGKSHPNNPHLRPSLLDQTRI